MSELGPEEKRAIVGIFLEAYNEDRKADYSEIDTTDEGIVDAKAESPSGRPALKLQITRAKELPEQYVKDKTLWELGGAVKTELRKRGIKGIFIHLSVNKLPYQKERIRRAAFFIAVLASRKRIGEALFSMDTTDAELLSNFFPEEIRRIRIRKGPFDEKSVVSVGHGGALLLSDDERIIEAYNLKAEKYGSAATGVILIIDSERTPVVFEFYLPTIKQELENRDDMFFDEVWVVNNFATGQKAVRVR